MKLALLVYLAGAVDNIMFLFILLGFGLIGIAVWKAIYISELEPERIWSSDSEKEQSEKKHFNDNLRNIEKQAVKNVKLSLILCVLAWVVAALIPREKTIYLMAGAYATEQLASNERVQKIGSDVLEVIETKLTELKGSEK